jgi:hypothetical protein
MLECGPNQTVKPCKHVTAREVDGEWIILDLNGGHYFGLDALGGVIWSHLSQGRTPVEIARLVAPNYEVKEADLLGDVVVLVKDLLQRGLVELSE